MCNKKITRTKNPTIEALPAEKGTPPVMHAAAPAGADVVRREVLESRNNIHQMFAGMVRMHGE